MLCILALASLLATPALGQDARAPLPQPMPAGYTADPQGSVRWIYPSKAADEAKDLQQTQHEAWNRIANQLGGQLSPSLDIRIGVDPEAVQALAPPGARLPA